MLMPALAERVFGAVNHKVSNAVLADERRDELIIFLLATASVSALTFAAVK